MKKTNIGTAVALFLILLIPIAATVVCGQIPALTARWESRTREDAALIYIDFSPLAVETAEPIEQQAKPADADAIIAGFAEAYEAGVMVSDPVDAGPGGAAPALLPAEGAAWVRGLVMSAGYGEEIGADHECAGIVTVLADYGTGEKIGIGSDCLHTDHGIFRLVGDDYERFMAYYRDRYTVIPFATSSVKPSVESSELLAFYPAENDGWTYVAYRPSGSLQTDTVATQHFDVVLLSEMGRNGNPDSLNERFGIPAYLLPTAQNSAMLSEEDLMMILRYRMASVAPEGTLIPLSGIRADGTIETEGEGLWADPEEVFWYMPELPDVKARAKQGNNESLKKIAAFLMTEDEEILKGCQSVSFLKIEPGFVTVYEWISLTHSLTQFTRSVYDRSLQ